MVAVLAGGGVGPTRCRKCRSVFTPKRLGQKFCKPKCRINYNSVRLRKKKLPVRKVKCLQCKDSFTVRTRAEVPRMKFCCHGCAAAYNMTLTRHRKYLVKLGYDEIAGVWYTPAGRRTTFASARKAVGLTKRPPPHDVTSDGRTVWVNGETGLLGRFGLNGIDIHQPMTLQSSKGECLHCTHGRTERAEWDTFVIKMLEHFGIWIRGSYLPIRFRKKRKKKDDLEASSPPRLKHGRSTSAGLQRG